MTIFPSSDPRTDRDQFHDERRPYFGASVAATLFNEHPFTTAADVWIEKVTGNNVTEETDDMVRGQELEPALASWFQRNEGKALIKNDDVYVKGIVAATPDYMMEGPPSLDDDSRLLTVPVEIKTTAMQHVDEPRRYWVMQLQAQMYATGAQKGYIVWMDGNLHLDWTEVDRDDEWIEMFVERAEQFMDSVSKEIMPDWVEREARHVIAQFPDPHDAVEVGEHGYELVYQYWEHKSAISYHEKEAATLRDQLFNLAENHDELTTDGNTIATLRPRKMPARFDTKRFAKDHPNLALEYMGEPMTTRVLNIPASLKKALEKG